jgi:UDP-glucose 4-epimerase/UDP-arabinose 4-epimerase
VALTKGTFPKAGGSGPELGGARQGWSEGVVMVDTSGGGKGSVLVTGGAGYIGAHTCKALAAAGWTPVVYDSLSGGYLEAVQWGPFVHGDVRDAEALKDALLGHGCRSVIHFAGLIEVGRSVVRPDLFFDHNTFGTAALLQAMRAAQAERIIFSSTAAVYGLPANGAAPIREEDPRAPINPYGDSKLAAERMIAAAGRAYGITGVALRYFNACGADPDGRIGEAHSPETHLIPLALEAALGTGKPLTVFGDDFDTPDGSCLRDYIHVDDLAAAHVAALEAELDPGSFHAFNVGVGRGFSVFEVLRAVEQATGSPTPHSVGPRREGDPPVLVADSARLQTALGWRPQHTDLVDIVRTAANWRRAPRYGFQA